MLENLEPIDNTLCEVIVRFKDDSISTYVILCSAVPGFIAGIKKTYRRLAARFCRKDSVTIKNIRYQALDSTGPYWWQEFFL